MAKERNRFTGGEDEALAWLAAMSRAGQPVPKSQLQEKGFTGTDSRGVKWVDGKEVKSDGSGSKSGGGGTGGGTGGNAGAGAHASTPGQADHPMAKEAPPVESVDLASVLPKDATSGLVAKVKAKVGKVLTRLAVLAYDAALHTPQILDAVGLVADTPADMAKLGYNPATAGTQAQTVANPLQDAGLPLTPYQAVNLATKILPAAIAWVKSQLAGKKSESLHESGATVADLLAGLLAILAEELGLPKPPDAARIAELLKK